MQPTSRPECLSFFLEGQYSPSNPIDDKKGDARSDIKEANLRYSTFADCGYSPRIPAKILMKFARLDRLHTEKRNNP